MQKGGDNMNINEALNSATERDDDILWLAFDETGLFSLHVGPEPEFSQDAGIVQINAHEMHQLINRLQFP